MSYSELMNDLEKGDSLTFDQWFYIIARTILIIGITPIALIILVLELDPLINYNIHNFFSQHPYITWIIIILIVSGILYSRSYKYMGETNGKFTVGTVFLFIGHIGMFIFYGLLIMTQIGIFPNGGFSGLYLIPEIFWMGFFYFISLVLIADGFSSTKIQR